MNVVTQSAAARSQAPDPWFEAMFEGAATGIAICQFDGRILDANPALCTMLGYSRHELAGAHARELCPEICPEPCPELRPELERGLSPENTGHASIAGPSPVERSPVEQKLYELM